MTDRPLSDEDRARIKRSADDAVREIARYWLAEVAKIEEASIDPGARWDLLKQAMSIIARGPERS